VSAPFVRFSRDRRGYEHFYLLQAIPDRRGRMRQRILYWYRTPPQVKVGREPFDERTQRALEAQNPDVRFDWDKIRNTPIPPVQPEYWRERRLAERASRQAAADETASGESASSPGAGGPERAFHSEPPRGRRRRRRDRGAPPRMSPAPEPDKPTEDTSIDRDEAGPSAPAGDPGGIDDDPQS
jgi:hypothetical protein